MDLDSGIGIQSLDLPGTLPGPVLWDQFLLFQPEEVLESETHHNCPGPFSILACQKGERVRTTVPSPSLLSGELPVNRKGDY